MAALTASMIGAAKMVFDVFNDGLANSMDGILVKAVVLGLAFLFGWGCGLDCIRSFGNLIYPMLVNIFAWGCLSCLCLLYIKVIQKLYLQASAILFFAMVSISALILVHIGILSPLRDWIDDMFGSQQENEPKKNQFSQG